MMSFEEFAENVVKEIRMKKISDRACIWMSFTGNMNPMG